MYRLMPDLAGALDGVPDELRSLLDGGLPRWSRMGDYDRHYLPLQQALRAVGDRDGVPPCALELAAWNHTVEAIAAGTEPRAKP